VYGLLSDPELSRVGPEQVGIAPIPVAEQGDASFSGLGGWNFLVNANSEDRLDEIWSFIEFMSSPESQKTLALRSSRLPTIESLYEDDEVLEKCRSRLSVRSRSRTPARGRSHHTIRTCRS
jgi:multiple sugar transport system substrate-binding protein